jgi:hypothetical protein
VRLRLRVSALAIWQAVSGRFLKQPLVFVLNCNRIMHGKITAQFFEPIKHPQKHIASSFIGNYPGQGKCHFQVICAL